MAGVIAVAWTIFGNAEDAGKHTQPNKKAAVDGQSSGPSIVSSSSNGMGSDSKGKSAQVAPSTEELANQAALANEHSKAAELYQRAADEAERGNDSKHASRLAQLEIEQRRLESEDQGHSTSGVKPSQQPDKTVAMPSKTNQLNVTAKALESSCNYVVENEDSWIEKVVSEKRDYFTGFTTAPSSDAEFEMRTRKLFTDYPYEDEQGRYRVIQRKQREQVQKLMLRFTLQMPADCAALKNVLVTITPLDLRLDSPEINAERDYQFTTGPLGPGQTFEKRIDLATTGLKPQNGRNVILVLGNSDFSSFAIVKPHSGHLIDQGKTAETLFNRFFDMTENQNAAARANEWRFDKHQVAARYVQHLISTGQIISGQPSGRADIGNIISYIFTFETQAGFQRTYRNGAVYLEQIGKEWVVKIVNIDGNEIGDFWPK